MGFQKILLNMKDRTKPLEFKYHRYVDADAIKKSSVLFLYVQWTSSNLSKQGS